MAKDKGFGILLNKLREEKNVTMEALGAGLCDVARLSKIEDGQAEADKFLRDRLLARLGMSEENYENFLYYSEYKVWRERQEIVHCILHRKMEEARQRLEEYRTGHFMDKALEHQFYLSMLAQIRRIEGAGKEELCQLFGQAVCLTIPEKAYQEPECMAFSMGELNLLLEYAYYSDAEFTDDWYKSVISYLEVFSSDYLAMAKIYPKAVFYYCKRKYEKRMDIDSEIGQLLKYCDKAIEILRQGNRMFYLWEILNIKEQLLQYLIMKNSGKEKAIKILEERKQTCVNWYTALEDVYEEYGVSKETKDFCYIYVDREAYCIGDVIRIRRKMFGMTMKQLSKGICSERTISRLERNETEPHREIVRLLFQRLNMPGEFCRKELVTGNPEALRLFIEAKRKSKSKKFDESDALLEQVRQMVSFEIPGNKQVIRRLEIINEWNKIRMQEEKTNCRYYIEQLKEVLQDTILYEVAVKQGEKYLTQNEVTCLQNIMMNADDSYPEVEQCRAVLFELYEKQRRLEDCFDMYEFVMGAIASDFGNKGEYDLSDEIALKILKKALIYRRMRSISGEIYDLLWNDMQRKKKKHPVKRDANIREELIKCIHLCEMSNEMQHISFFKNILEKQMK